MRIWLNGKTARLGAEMVCNKQELLVLQRALELLCREEMATARRTNKSSTVRLADATAMQKEITSYLNDVYRKESVT